MEFPTKTWSKLTTLFLILQGADVVFANTQTSAFQPEAPKDCAKPCKDSGYNSARWTSFEAADYFQRCTFSPALFSYDLKSLSLPSAIMVCKDTEDSKELGEEIEGNATSTRLYQPDAPIPEFDVRVSRIAAMRPEPIIPGQAIGAAMTVQQQIIRVYEDSPLNSTASKTKEDVILHAHWADAVVGIFIGADLDKVAVANGPLEDFISGILEHGIGQTLQAESCSGNNTSSSFGIIADMSIGPDRLSTVHAAVQAWSQGKSSASANKVDAYSRHATSSVPKDHNDNSTTISAVSFIKAKANAQLAQYAVQDCQETEVQPGENCETLAKRCDINLNQFLDFNGKPDCTKLQIKQRVCCSAGGLADLRPQKQANGDCVVHQIQPGDSCYSIAEQYKLKQDDIPLLNKQTWGWNGCRPDKFYPNVKICVSPGNPPFPSADPKATCGPTKPGTRKPATGTSADWALLNECPLRACCNIWGNCGMTDDFCVDKSSGAPGSSSGPNGCIANCELSIQNNKKPPAQFRKVGYFEAWNLNRDCLLMDVDDIPAGKYTHIHYSFGDINNDYQVGVDRDMFDRFRKSNKGFKKIIAFGGWAFSTEIRTAYIFRTGVSGANRERLATSLTNFVLQEGLDGIDFDWEYPSVPDMPWLPKSSPNEASEYLEFLRLVRRKLPNKSISIAAPASYWYLKAFPIKEISQVVDYIVYMTYDLHGQWDYDNEWAQAGCKKGNCLRDHVDLNETKTALAMITKAGVQADKVMVGISSYGRQFRMTDPRCSGPQCTYEGPDGRGTKGRCTNEPAYISNAEIAEIIATNPSAKVVSSGGYSKFLTYSGMTKPKGAPVINDAVGRSIQLEPGSNWVSYMDENDKVARTNLWKSLNFGGTIDWAIDLHTFDHDNGPNVANALKKLNKKIPRGGGSMKSGTGRPGNFAETCGTDSGWKNVPCNDPAVNKYAEMHPLEIWVGTKANDAWCAGVQYWTKLRDAHTNKTTFTDALIGGGLKGDTPFKCEILNDQTTTGCIATRSCRGESLSSAPAVQQITLTIQNINSNFINMYQGLNDALNARSMAVGAFKELIPKPDKTMDILLTILSVVTSFGSVSFFNGFVKTGAAKFASDAAKNDRNREWARVGADNVKDYASIAIAAGMASAKEKEKSLAEKNAKDINEKILLLWEKTIEAWKESLIAQNKRLFSGTEESIATLTAFIKDGRSYARDPLQRQDVQRQATKFIASIMVPDVWRLQGFYPVLLDAGFRCGTKGIGIRQWTSKKDIGDAEFCFNEGGSEYGKPYSGPRQYQLLAVKGEYQCTCTPARACSLGGGENKCSMLSELPGLKTIKKPVDDWAGANIIDMVNNANEGSHYWNGNHRWDTADAENQNLIVEMAGGLEDMDISKIPGLSHIPICGWAEIKANWISSAKKDWKKSNNFPCN